MQTLNRENLFSLEEYAAKRQSFKAEVLAHKKNRQVTVGSNATLYFEDRLTMQYQIQEMLRIERIFEAEGIEEELATYNPLIPDGHNWKATFMIEYPDPQERKKALEKLVGIEDRVWVQVDGFAKVWAIADEDLERSTQEKTSAVHFMRFELSEKMIEALKAGAKLSLGIEHDAYHYVVSPVSENIREALVADFS